jgi:MFS family permease
MDKKKASNPWLTLTAVCFGGFMAAMDTSIVNIILPTLVQVLQTEFAWVQWVAMGYLFTVTVFILCFGKIGDIIGRKKVNLPLSFPLPDLP